MTHYVETNENVPLYIGEFPVLIPPKYGKFVYGFYYPNKNYFNIYQNTTRSLTNKWINNCEGFCPDVLVTNESRYEITVNGVRTPSLDLSGVETEVYLTGIRDYRFNLDIQDPDQSFENVTIIVKPKIHENRRFDGPVPLLEFNNYTFHFDQSDTLKMEIYRPWPDCLIHRYETKVHIMANPSTAYLTFLISGMILFGSLAGILIIITVCSHVKKEQVSRRKSSVSTEISHQEL